MRASEQKKRQSGSSRRDEPKKIECDFFDSSSIIPAGSSVQYENIFPTLAFQVISPIEFYFEES